MKRLLPAAPLAAALLACVPASAQEARAPTLEQTMMLRCSAAFAIVASEQQRGVAYANEYPPLGQRGREYFVRASAQLMDEMQLPREEIARRLQAEAQALQQASAMAPNRADYMRGIMQPCLVALDACGL